MNDQLRPQHVTALIALMCAARAISNTELKELAGFSIDGDVRRTLNDLHLVDSNQERRNKPFVHELTDAGWKRCEVELAGDRLPNSGHVGGALHMLMTGVHRFLEREHQRPAHVFQAESTMAAPVQEPTHAADATDIATDIAAAYRSLATKQGDWVRLAELRPLLDGTARDDVDRALKAMSRSGQANLAPDPDRKSLTAADRAAAIRIGGEDNHLLVVERS